MAPHPLPLWIAPCRPPAAVRVSFASRLAPSAAGTGHTGLPVGNMRRGIWALCALVVFASSEFGRQLSSAWEPVCDGAERLLGGLGNFSLSGTSSLIFIPWRFSRFALSATPSILNAENEEHPKFRASPSSSNTLDLTEYVHALKPCRAVSKRSQRAALCVCHVSSMYTSVRRETGV